MEKAPPPKRPRYDAAFRAEALRLASESRSTLAAARALNIDAKRIYAWQKAAQPPLPADPTEAAEVRALRAANKRLAQELDILKKAIQVLDVVPSRYYAWRAAQAAGAAGKTEPAWETEMVAVFDHHKRRYGTRRLRVELREKGHRVGRQALRTALRRHERKALQPKSFVPRTTDSTHGLRCAPNLLLDQPKPTQANRVWVSDITYLPLANGDWAYLCAFQDLCTKHVVGWQVRADMPEALVTSALQRALLAQRPAPGLIVHSDRGGQYVGNAYKALLHDAQAQLSHSRRGDCYDNAQAESLWSRLKTEELEARDWPVVADLADAQASVAAYFDYYNHERRHSSIGYQKPYQFHQQILNNIAQFSPA